MKNNAPLYNTEFLNPGKCRGPCAQRRFLNQDGFCKECKQFMEGMKTVPINHSNDDDMVMVKQPHHYRSHPSGVECIEIAQHFSFNLGNAIKYIWRAGLKSDNAIQDLMKAIEYLQFEVSLLRKAKDDQRKKLIEGIKSSQQGHENHYGEGEG